VPTPLSIVSTVLHQIDVENQELKNIPISGEHSDLEGYLSDLLEEIGVKEQKRQYGFVRETTEFYQSLLSYYKIQDLQINPQSTALAERLLEKEILADKRYGHLGNSGKGHVKKGSYLQFLYKEDDQFYYLGVKIEHQTFLDEKDFKMKIGLSIANKVYKASKVSFNNAGDPNNVFVYDTNKKPAVYWWNEFLELKEVRNDSYNTNTASTEVVRELNKIKKPYPEDFTILKNHVVASFKQNGEMKYDEFVDNTIANYEPVNSKLKEELPKITENLKKLPEKKNFDTRFTLVPSEVPFNKSVIPLSKEVSISLVDGIENLEEKVWAEKTKNGRKLVVIDSPTGYERFVKKERE
jgi:hypothetical protein